MDKKTKTWNAPEGYFTRQETMDKLGISSSTLNRIVQEGNFTEDGETIRFRGKRLYRQSVQRRTTTGGSDRKIEPHLHPSTGSHAIHSIIRERKFKNK